MSTRRQRRKKRAGNSGLFPYTLVVADAPDPGRLTHSKSSMVLALESVPRFASKTDNSAVLLSSAQVRRNCHEAFRGRNSKRRHALSRTASGLRDCCLRCSCHGFRTMRCLSAPKPGSKHTERPESGTRANTWGPPGVLCTPLPLYCSANPNKIQQTAHSRAQARIPEKDTAQPEPPTGSGNHMELRVREEQVRSAWRRRLRGSVHVPSPGSVGCASCCPALSYMYSTGDFECTRCSSHTSHGVSPPFESQELSRISTSFLHSSCMDTREQPGVFLR